MSTFQANAIWVEVFDKDWNPVCICSTEAGWSDNATLNDLYSDCDITVVNATGKGTLEISDDAWTDIVDGHGYYWVVEARTDDVGSSDVLLAPTHYWSSAEIIDASEQHVTTTTFHGGGTWNLLTLSYNILPPGGTWTGAVTIPWFTINVYASSDGDLDDVADSGILVASYPVTASQYLTGTATHNQCTLNLPASAINSELLTEAASSADDDYLVAEMDFSDGSSVDARFQGGAFATTDPATKQNTVWVFGGASLDADTPDTSDYTDNVTITSAGQGVTANGTISDSDGDAAVQFAQTFSGDCTMVRVYTYDNDSTIDGSGITNVNTSFYVLGGDGNDVFYGGPGENTLILGNGTDFIDDQYGWGTIQVGDGDDTIIVGSGPWTVTAGDGNSTYTLGSGYLNLTVGDGNNSINGLDGNYTFNIGNGENSIVCGDGIDQVFPNSEGDNGNNVINFGSGHNDSVQLGNGDNLVSFTDSIQFSVSVGDGDNDIEFSGTCQDIALGGGSNTLHQTAPDCQSDDTPSISVTAPGGDNAFFLDAASTSAWTISTGSGGNDLVLTDFPTDSSTTVNGSVIGLPSGGSINYTGAMNPMTCLVNGASNTLVLDNGGTVYWPDEIAAGTNLTVEGGTSVFLCDQSVSLGAVNLVNGTIGDGSITATSYVVESGSIDANLAGAGATLVMSGGGIVDLTGDNTYSGSTTIGGAPSDTGTLAVNSGSALGTGSIYFAAACTLQALDDLTISQAIVTPSAAGLTATIDTCGYSVNVTGNISGSASGGGLCAMDSTNSDGIFVASGTNSGLLGPVSVTSGIFEVASPAALPSDIAAGGVAAGATLAVDVENAGTWSQSEIAAILASGDFSPGANVGFDTGAAGNFTCSTDISDTAAGPLGVDVFGGGMFFLTGNDTYTNETVVQGGTLEAASPGALPGYATGSVCMQPGATLAVAVSGSNAWNAPQIATLLTSGDFAAGANFGIDTGTGSFEYNNSNYTPICDTTAGPLGLVVLGSGTLTLDGYNSNSYTNGTTILGATVIVGGPGVLGASTGSLTIVAGGVNLNGSDLAIGPLNGDSGAFITNTSSVSASTLTIGQAGGAIGGSYAGNIECTGGEADLDAIGTGELNLTGVIEVGQFAASGGGAITGAINASSSFSVDASSVDLADASCTMGSFQATDGADIEHGTITATSCTLDNATVGASLLGGSGGMTVSNLVRLTGTDDITGPITVSNPTDELDILGSLTTQTVTTYGIVVVDGTGTLAADVVDDGSLVFNISTDETFAGSISGNSSGSVSMTGLATLGLAGADSYGGGTQIFAGMVQFTVLAAVPTNGLITIQSGGALEAAGAYANAGAWVGSQLIDQNSSGTLAVTSEDSTVNLTDYPSLWIGAAGSGSTFGGSITPPTSGDYMLGGGPGTLTVTASLGGTYGVLIDGNVVFNAANSYTLGTAVLAGNVQLANADALGSTSGPLAVDGGTLNLGTYWIVVGAANVDGGAIVRNGSISADSYTLGATSISASLTGGSGGMTVNGLATLSGTNSFGGTTTVNPFATLVAGSNYALSQYSILDCNGTVDMAGFSCSVFALMDDNGAGVVTNNVPGITSTLTITQGNGSSYVGLIQDGNGQVGVVMDGGNTQAFAGYGNYSAGTTVANGTFIITSPNALSMALTVAAGGTFIFDPSYGDSPQTSDKTGPLHNAGGGLGEAGGTPAPQDVPPVLTAIRCTGAEGPLVDANLVVFEVDFNKNVTTPATSDFTVTGIGGTVSAVSGSGCHYFVTVRGVTGSGTLGLAVVSDSNSIADEAGTPLAALATIVVDQQYTIDRQLFYCGPSGNAAALGSYSWDAGLNWAVGSPSGPRQTYYPGSSVIFAGVPQTVQIGNPVEVTSITILTDGWMFSGAPIKLTGATGQVNIALGTTTMLCGLSGNLLKTGDGRLALPGGVTSCSFISVGAGILDLGDTTAAVKTVTLTAGSIVGGVLNVADTLQLYNGTVLADITGTASLDKLGPATVVLGGDNSYSGGTNAVAGTLIAASQASLPGAVSGTGIVIVQPTLYGSGTGDWTACMWALADGTLTGWIDGASVVIAAGADLNLSTSVNVSAITIQGDATIEGNGTLVLPAGGTTIDVLAGTATFDVALAGGNPVKTGLGTADFLAPPPMVDDGQALGPGAVFMGTESLAALDPAMFSLVQSLFVDHTIDRTDMIQILESASVDGAVTPTALAALEMLTTPQNEALLAMPDYVGVLASDVVNGNAANAHYQGQPLGNLAQQTTPQAMATTLTLLVDKWFYGTDLPAIDPVFISLSASYSAVAGPLFGENANESAEIPSSQDMRQGSVGDCYFIAALGALADSSAAAIENMFIDNGDGTWSVRFYYQEPLRGWVADYITVNTMLPVWSNGNLVYAQPGPNGGLWLPLLEKGYAQWNETGHEGRDGTNTYAALNSGCMNTVDEQVLGTVAMTYSPVAGDLAAKQSVVAALQSGKAVTAAIFLSGDPDVFYQLGLVSCHAYVIASYDADPNSPTYDMFFLENPWGCDEPLPLSWSQLCQYGWIAVADTSATVTPDSTAAGATAEATGADIHAAALATVSFGQYQPDAALVADVANNANLHAAHTTTDAYVRALELILAESGR